MKPNEWKITGSRSPMILAGKMRRPDVLSYSFFDYSTVCLTGLFRGRPRYGQIKVPVKEFVSALMNAGFEEYAHDVTRVQSQI